MGYVGENGSASAKEIAAALSVPQSSVGEQLRRLSAEGLLELLETKHRRGAVERYYRWTSRGFEIDKEEAEQVPEKAARQIVMTVIRLFLSNAKAALAAAEWTPAQSDSFWNSISIRTDLQGMRELSKIHQKAAADINRARAQIHARVNEEESETVLLSSSIFLFQVPEDPESPECRE
jgi:DNA-binding MarR family transcriptional regulator